MMLLMFVVIIIVVIIACKLAGVGKVSIPQPNFGVRQSSLLLLLCIQVCQENAGSTSL